MIRNRRHDQVFELVVSTRKREVKDGKAEDATRQPEQVRAFRDTWKMGIHSYLAYLRDRLTVARDLLIETGSVFVQIGDENLHLVRCVLDEVFGSQNFAGLIAFATTTGRGSTLLGQICDYIIWYAKDRDHVKYRQIYSQKEGGEPGAARYDNVELPDGVRRRLTTEEKASPLLISAGCRFFSTDQITSAGETVAGSGKITFKGRDFKCPTGLAGRDQEGNGTHRQDTLPTQDRRRHPKGLRLQTRASRHSQINRQ
jgi:adenine-specific DNA-methyltransferase